MAYALYRATGPLMTCPGRLLGRFASYERAMRERDADVLVRLAAAGGYYLQVDHVIVGPGLAGPVTEHRVSTALGVDPEAGRVPTPADLLEAAGWLAQVRAGR
ncbi:MAG TPA: hypothetical protein VF223_04225 [Trebonia sp.]|nr:hypothetical protein [Nocardioidaceae bacterium]HEU5026480.1 hypothetical protein [Spirillospora sp.]